MPRVDVDDDSIRRFVVRHYRYDPERRERRHVVVDCFDAEAEFLAGLDAVRAAIEARRSSGQVVHPTEHASGVTYEPGDRARAATGHLLRRMLDHGVNPSRYIDPEDLPSNISYLEASEPHPAWGSEQVAAELRAGKERHPDSPRRRARLGPPTRADAQFRQQVKETTRGYNKRVRLVGGIYAAVVALSLWLFGARLTGGAQTAYLVLVLVGLLAIVVWMGVLLVRQWRWRYHDYRALKSGDEPTHGPTG
ncbi:hypothetical protein ACFUC1_08970 [Pedococcus sp. NPDC057267]|uniref:hypothetical protein n=1 Tax=Pedococcus sp. NPDC057267 TaxID=3346077 RepID=UPI0036439DEF